MNPVGHGARNLVVTILTLLEVQMIRNGLVAKRSAWPVLALALLILLGVNNSQPLVAQETGANNAAATMDKSIRSGRSRRSSAVDYITIDVREKELRAILKEISRQVDVNIVADPEVDEKVSVSLDSVHWREALSVIARETNCTIVNDSVRLIRFTQPPSISIEFLDADLKVVIDLLAKQSGANIVTAEDVTGKVSLSLRNVPWRDALETIVRTAGYVTVERSDGPTDIIQVVRQETLTKQLETRVIKLRYVRPPEAYTPIISDVEKHANGMVGDAGDSGGGDEEELGGASFSLLTALRKALSADGEMDFDPKNNVLIIKDVKPSLDAIENIVAAIDVEPPLVEIELQLVSTSSDDVLEKGLKFDNPNTPMREGFMVKAFAPPPNALATAGSLQVNGGTFPFDIGRWNTVGNGNFSALGVLDFTESEILLRLVRDDDNSKILQQPKLMTLDNHASTIFVGESIPFAVQKISQDQNGNLSVEIDENDRSPINIGFTLYVSPHVIPGTDTVQMIVIPKVSSLSGTSSPLEGFERFSFADPSSTNEAFIDLPRESSQTIVTNLRVESGHTAVIGGLHTERKFEIVTKVPLISSLPFVGNIFTWTRKANSVDHLLILMTPRIIKSAQESDAAYERAMNLQKKYDYFHKKEEENKK